MTKKELINTLKGKIPNTPNLNKYKLTVFDETFSADGSMEIEIEVEDKTTNEMKSVLFMQRADGTTFLHHGNEDWEELKGDPQGKKLEAFILHKFN